MFYRKCTIQYRQLQNYTMELDEFETTAIRLNEKEKKTGKETEKLLSLA